MKYPALILFLLMAQAVSAQIKPDFFPEDVNPEAIESRCYCQPGIVNKSRSRGLEINYGLLTGGKFNPEENISGTGPLSTFNHLRRFEFDLKVPVVRKDYFKLLLGYKYSSVSYNIDNVGSEFSETFMELGEHNFKSSALSVIATVPLNDRNYLAFRFRYSANGDYNGVIKFEEKYSIYKFLAVYAIKPHEDFEWGIGLNVSKSFRRTSILPFLVYNRNFNRRWGIESAFPGFIFGRRNINSGNILLFGIEYDSQSYRLGVSNTPQGNLDYAFNHSEIIASLRLEHQFASWVWGHIKVGYQNNFSTDFEAESANTTFFKVEPSNGFFFNIGVFLSPPDDAYDGN